MKEFIPLLIVFIVAFTTLAIVLLAHLDDILDTYMHFKDWEDRRKKELKKYDEIVNPPVIDDTNWEKFMAYSYQEKTFFQKVIDFLKSHT